MLFQTKQNINSGTGGILCFEGERTVAVFCEAGEIGKEDRREGGHLQT